MLLELFNEALLLRSPFLTLSKSLPHGLPERGRPHDRINSGRAAGPDDERSGHGYGLRHQDVRPTHCADKLSVSSGFILYSTDKPIEDVATQHRRN